MVNIKNLSLCYGQKEVLYDISCEIARGKITAFIGKSGVGKTSLIRCLAQLVTHYEGSILFQGEILRSLKRVERAQKISMVFQEWNLFPHQTVEKNCISPQVSVLKRSTREAREHAHTMLEKLGMESFANKYPCTLSGGQKQRVAIARALCMHPEMILFDEPSSSLDPKTTDSLVQLIRELRSEGVTVVFSSHDIPFISSLFDTVHLLEKGMLKATATAENWESIAPVAQFLQQISPSSTQVTQ